MQKKSESQNSNLQDSIQQKSLEKPKTVFDHIKHIRESKSPEYYQNLSETDSVTFNKYVILMGLSMDKNSICNIAIISKYLDILSPSSFYRVCCDVTPVSGKYQKWIKSSKQKYSKQLIETIASYFKISKYDAIDYCQLFFKDEEHLKELIEICSNIGYNDVEIERMLNGKNE